MKSFTEILAAVYDPGFWLVIDEWGDCCIFCGASDGRDQFERGEIHHYGSCLLREIRVHLMQQVAMPRRFREAAIEQLAAFQAIKAERAEADPSYPDYGSGGSPPGASSEPSPTDPIYLGNNASGSTVVLPPDRPSLAKEIERIVDEVFAPEPKVPEDAHDDDEPLKCSNVGCTICYPRGLVEPEPEPALPSLCKICLLVSACPRVTVDDITTVQQPVQTCEHYTATSRDAPTEVVPEHVVYRTARAEPEVVPVVQPERLHSWQSMKSGKAVRCTNCGLVAFGGVELQPGQGRSTCSLPVGASIGVCPGSLSPVPADPSPVKTVQPAVPLVQVICPRCHVTEVVPAAGGVLPDLPQITLMSGPFMVVSWAHPAFGRQTGVYCRACWVSTEASIIASILPPAVTCQPIQTGDPRQSA